MWPLLLRDATMFAHCAAACTPAAQNLLRASAARAKTRVEADYFRTQMEQIRRWERGFGTFLHSVPRWNRLVLDYARVTIRLRPAAV